MEGTHTILLFHFIHSSLAIMGSNVSKPAAAEPAPMDEKTAFIADLAKAHPVTSVKHDDAPDFGEELACSHLEAWSRDFEEVHPYWLFI